MSFASLEVPMARATTSSCSRTSRGVSSSARSSRGACDRRFGIGADGDPRRAVLRGRLLHGSSQLGRQPGPDVRQRHPVPGQDGVRPRPDRSHGDPRRHPFGDQDARAARPGRRRRLGDRRDGCPVRPRRCRWPATRTNLRGGAVRGRRACFKATALSMGNPHLVLFVEEDPDDVDVHRLGPSSNTTSASPSGRTSSSSPSRATA